MAYPLVRSLHLPVSLVAPGFSQMPPACWRKTLESLPEVSAVYSMVEHEGLITRDRRKGNYGDVLPLSDDRLADEGKSQL